MDNLDLPFGKVIYNEFNIDFEKPFFNQLEALTEDLMQIECENNYLVDLGWYPEYNPNGELVVQVIKDYNWDKPIYKKKCRTEIKLKEILLKALNISKK